MNTTFLSKDIRSPQQQQHTQKQAVPALVLPVLVVAVLSVAAVVKAMAARQSISNRLTYHSFHVICCTLKLKNYAAL